MLVTSDPDGGDRMRRRPDVTLTQLRYFVAAATQLSMTKAADELHIAQSAVSAAISQLEAQIGTQLFIRHRARGLELTAAGEGMLRDTRALLAHLDEVIDNVSGQVDQVGGAVRLACSVTLTPYVLPRLLTELGMRYPDLQVEVIETSADAVPTALRNGAVELALTYDRGLGAGIEVEQLAVATPYVVLPPDHRLAARKALRLSELANEPMVLLDLPDCREYFKAILANAGVTPHVRYRSASHEAVRGLVAQGHGFAILNQIPVYRDTSNGGAVSPVTIRDELPGLPVVLARLQSVRATARAHAIAAAARIIFTDRRRAG